jgi:hypothetical protein
MTHERLPSFNTLNMDISNFHRLALAPAPPNLSPYSASTTPFWSWAQRSLFTGHRFEVSDFQSNGRIEDHAGSPSLTPPLAGLGIYTDSAYGNNRTEVLSSSSFSPDSQPQSGSSQILEQQRASADEFNHLFEHQLPNSWSFGSNTSNSAFTATANDVASHTTHAMDGLSLMYPPSSDAASWSFDSLSAASGIPVELLAVQLSTAADLALRQISSCSNANSGTSDGGLPNPFSTNTLHSPFWPVLPCNNDEMATVPEISTRQYSARWNEASVGVNPVEIMGDLDLPYKPNFSLEKSLEPCVPSASATSHLSSLYSSDSFFMDALNASSDSHHSLASHMSSVQPSTNAFFPDAGNLQNREHQPGLTAGILVELEVKPKGDHTIPTVGELHEEDGNSDYELQSNQGLSSDESSPFPSPPPRKRKRPMKTKGKSKSTQKIPLISKVVIKPEQMFVTIEELNIDLGTPVFDAHRGISLVDLKAKAGRYSSRNPGYEYDKRWLISFAGKLSVQGELLSDFRCYVSGCTQTNKRRDHILIHVGGHLDQRPFGCMYWYAATFVPPPPFFSPPH